MVSVRTSGVYRGYGWVHNTELTTVVLDAWVELVDDGDGGFVDGATGWGGYGITADYGDSTGHGPMAGTWTLRLNNGRTGSVHVAEFTEAGMSVNLEGLGEPPFDL